MTTEDLDLIRAAGEGMIDRREDEGHPVNTDPPKPQIVAQAGEAIAAGDAVVVAEDGLLRRLNPPRLASQDEADSGVEEDARHVSGVPNFNALTASEEHYMALARSCSDETMRQHLADFGITHPRPVPLRSLAGRCYILARRLEMGRKS